MHRIILCRSDLFFQTFFLLLVFTWLRPSNTNPLPHPPPWHPLPPTSPHLSAARNILLRPFTSSNNRANYDLLLSRLVCARLFCYARSSALPDLLRLFCPAPIPVNSPALLSFSEPLRSPAQLNSFARLSSSAQLFFPVTPLLFCSASSAAMICCAAPPF
jgi:hypothetical protein